MVVCEFCGTNSAVEWSESQSVTLVAKELKESLVESEKRTQDSISESGQKVAQSVEQSEARILASQRLTQIEIQKSQAATQKSALRSELSDIDSSAQRLLAYGASPTAKKEFRALQVRRDAIVPELIELDKYQAALARESTALISWHEPRADAVATISTPREVCATGFPEPSKSKTTAALLAIFLGTFGVHHFYLGHTWTGIICLLFCWSGIPTILGLIEGFNYLLHSDDDWLFKYPP